MNRFILVEKIRKKSWKNKVKATGKVAVFCCFSFMTIESLQSVLSIVLTGKLYYDNIK